MKFGDFFDKEWVCQYSTIDHCGESYSGRDPLHDRCGWQYVADITPYEYENLKDARLIK